MKCPRCDEQVPIQQESCPQCGLNLTVFRTLGALKHAVQRTKIDSDTIAHRLRELEQQVTSLESQIISQLKSAQAPVAPGETPPTVVEAPSPFVEKTEAVTEGATPEMGTARTAEDMLSRLRSKGGAAIAPPTTVRSPKPSGMGEVHLGQKWLLIAGLVLTVLAVGYFLKYSFDRNWVGPAGRVSSAYLTGIALLAVGEFCRRRKLGLFGLYLFGGGIADLYFATYAAFQIYNLIGQVPAFGLMVLITILAGVLALFYDTKWLAVLGIIGGFLTPVVLSTGIDNQIALMTYMTILSCGILAIGLFKQWHLLNYLGMAFTWMLFSGWYFKHYADSKFWATTFFLNVYFLAYAVVPFAYYFARQSQKQVTGFGITIPNAFIAFGYSFATIRSQYSLELVSVVSITYAAIFFAMATYLYSRNRENLRAFILLVAKGMLFLVITVPILFSAHWITVFWAVQGVVLMWAALRLSDNRLRYSAIVLILIATAKLLFHDYADVFELYLSGMFYEYGFFDGLVERWLTIAVTLGVLFRAGQMLKSSGYDQNDEKKGESSLFFVTFAILLFIALNIEVAAFFYDMLPRARFASISALWALFATGLIVLGFVQRKSILRRTSIGLFAVTIIKVIVRDMANVDTPYRILSFLVLGLLLVGASYLYHRFKDRILAVNEEAAQS